jgi:hypothetical protein
MKQYFIDHPESLEKISKASIDRFATKESRNKASERTRQIYLDHRWYGNVTYNDRDKYCFLFGEYFKERCRAFDGYKSVLSGKTKKENIIKGKPINLSVHHVYYQKKACCGWDEDNKGYYAMINLGTKKNPKIVKHNIKGNPNKFVTLTHSENIKANTDKLTWIEIFEKIIEDNGGKCYYTPEEMDIIVKNNHKTTK